MADRTRRAVLVAATGGLVALSGCSGTGKTVRRVARRETVARAVRRFTGDDEESAEPETAAPELETDWYRPDERTEFDERRFRSSAAVEDERDERRDLASKIEEFEFPLYRYDGTLEVSALSYRHWEWSIDAPAAAEDELSLEYEVVVRDGPAIDVFVMKPDEFSFYRNGQNALYLTEPSTLNTSFTRRTVALEPGSYVFVLDNTYDGKANPNGPTDTATVSVSYELHGPREWRSG